MQKIKLKYDGKIFWAWKLQAKSWLVRFAADGTVEHELTADKF